MTFNLRKIIIALSLSILFAIAITVRANPSYFATSASTASATSTVQYMTGGTATTTIYYDAYADNTNASVNKATMDVQFTGSSTASTLNIAFEYALNNGVYNCVTSPTACDWYRDTYLTVPYSTTTQTLSLGATNVYVLPFSSSTVGGAAGTATRTTRTFNVSLPTRFVRAVLTLPTSSLNGAVWATIQPVKEQPE